jgi:hypothetical protein
MQSRLKRFTTISCVAIFLLAASDVAQAQQRGTHGPRWGFAVASGTSRDARHPRLATIWNPADNLDSVWIVMGRSHTLPVDSIRISARSGPPRLASEKNPLVAAHRSDSLGEWVALPTTLLRRGSGERNVPMPMRVLGVFSPTALEAWALSQNPKLPVVTRIAADIYRRKTYEHAELYLEASAVGRERIVSPQSKPKPAKPVRK